MSTDNYAAVFTPEVMARLLPLERSDEFFAALFGDPTAGAYDISLDFEGHKNGNLNFALKLNQRPGQCLVCSLTRGLPEVFRRHPVINLAGIAREVGKMIGHEDEKITWRLAPTRQHSTALHSIPFIIEL